MNNEQLEWEAGEDRPDTNEEEEIEEPINEDDKTPFKNQAEEDLELEAIKQYNNEKND